MGGGDIIQCWKKTNRISFGDFTKIEWGDETGLSNIGISERKKNRTSETYCFNVKRSKISEYRNIERQKVVYRIIGVSYQKILGRKKSVFGNLIPLRYIISLKEQSIQIK